MAVKKTKRMGWVKKLAAFALSGCMFMGLGSEALAASLEDVFDEHVRVVTPFTFPRWICSATTLP